MFYAFLKKSPEVKVLKREIVHLRINATYFRHFFTVCYQDHEDGYTQLLRFSNGEHFEEIRDDLANLIKLGVQIESITTDGHKSILRAIKKSLPDPYVQWNERRTSSVTTGEAVYSIVGRAVLLDIYF